MNNAPEYIQLLDPNSRHSRPELYTDELIGLKLSLNPEAHDYAYYSGVRASEFSGRFYDSIERLKITRDKDGQLKTMDEGIKLNTFIIKESNARIYNACNLLLKTEAIYPTFIKINDPSCTDSESLKFIFQDLSKGSRGLNEQNHGKPHSAIYGRGCSTFKGNIEVMYDMQSDLLTVNTDDQLLHASPCDASDFAEFRDNFRKNGRSIYSNPPIISAIDRHRNSVNLTLIDGYQYNEEAKYSDGQGHTVDVYFKQDQSHTDSPSISIHDDQYTLLEGNVLRSQKLIEHYNELDELLNNSCIHKESRSMDELTDLWLDLGDVPINNNEELDGTFMHFEVGSDIHEVWAWFEEQNPDFCCGDMMNGVSPCI